MNKINKFIKNNIIWIILSITIFILYIIITSIFNNTIHNFDNFIYNTIKYIINEKNTIIFKIITEFGSYYMMLLISALFITLNKDKRFDKYFAINILMSFILNFILKIIIERPRPENISLIIEKGFSFPSGHAMISFTFYGFIIYYIFKSKLNKKLKVLLITILSLLISLIGFSRIYLGVHYASDVFGGYLFAFIYLSLFIKFIYTKKTIKK